MLYSTFGGNTATRCGIANEDKARQEYITNLRERGGLDWNVAVCGLFVSVAEPWLAASPDGTICSGTDMPHFLGLHEIKCPFNMRAKTLVYISTREFNEHNFKLYQT